MKSIDKIFCESLKYFVRQEKSQKSFAAKVGISAPYLNDMLSGRRYGEDQTKRKIAAAVGFPDRHYEEFLDIGRLIIKGDQCPEAADFTAIGDNALQKRGFFTVVYSDSMDLGPDNGIKVTNNTRTTHVIIHGPSCNRTSSSGLQAFKVLDDYMAPVIPKKSDVIVDLTLNEPEKNKDSKVYLVCLDKKFGLCTLRYLSWVDSSYKTLLVAAENRKYKTGVFCLEDIKIVGRVILSQSFF
ncbi:MAG: LexA family transcriptional regulator [Deltaproteobacteria bacterium]|jgi:transcriptional regulator with XRE-family HTH domain|nr:LexA family transcriptional regulator [Deltaproteobacteria bacterium]